MPSADYSTAFDRWSTGCCFLIFISLLEFIAANFLSTRNDPSQTDQVEIRRSIGDMTLDPSLIEENSQLQPQHGDINLLRKLHIQTAYAKLQNGDWYAEKMDLVFRTVYPIGFTVFVAVYTMGIYRDD